MVSTSSHEVSMLSSRLINVNDVGSMSGLRRSGGRGVPAAAAAAAAASAVPPSPPAAAGAREGGLLVGCVAAGARVVILFVHKCSSWRLGRQGAIASSSSMDGADSFRKRRSKCRNGLGETVTIENDGGNNLFLQSRSCTIEGSSAATAATASHEGSSVFERSSSSIRGASAAS